MATETVPASDDVALAEIHELAVQLGDTPGRNKLMTELGWGASRSSRLLKLYADQSGDRSAPDGQTDQTEARQSAPARDGRSADVADGQSSAGPSVVDGGAEPGPGSSGDPVRDRSAQATPQTEPDRTQGQSAPRSGAQAPGAPTVPDQSPGPRTAAADRAPGVGRTGGPQQTAPVWTPIEGTGPVEQSAGRPGRVDRGQPWGLIAATLAISLSAFVAVWGGWVGLGELAGFGTVNLLPGFGGGLHVNLAITLPIGIEAYAAAALYVAVAGLVAGRARWFAATSAGVALLLGAFGQAAYHLLEARGVEVAPDGIVVFVSVLPVFVLGAAGVLLHLVLEARKS